MCPAILYRGLRWLGNSIEQGKQRWWAGVCVAFIIIGNKMLSCWKERSDCLGPLSLGLVSPAQCAQSMYPTSLGIHFPTHSHVATIACDPRRAGQPIRFVLSLSISPCLVASLSVSPSLAAGQSLLPSVFQSVLSHS